MYLSTQGAMHYNNFNRFFQSCNSLFFFWSHYNPGGRNSVDDCCNDKDCDVEAAEEENTSKSSKKKGKKADQKFILLLCGLGKSHKTIEYMNLTYFDFAMNES